MPSAAVTVTVTVLAPEESVVPVTTTEASVSTVTAFTTAEEVLAGKVTEPETAFTPFTLNTDKSVLADLATTTVTV